MNAFYVTGMFEIHDNFQGSLPSAKCNKCNEFLILKFLLKKQDTAVFLAQGYFF